MLLTTMFTAAVAAAAQAHAQGAATSPKEPAAAPMMSPMTSYLSDPTQCQGAMDVWDYGSGMCQVLPMAAMPMRMVMLHGNAFGVGVSEQGPRGRRRFAAPNMLMVDAGSSLGDQQYVNVEFMGTLERWTFPEDGYPEATQIGERDRHQQPFIDAQHPHNSPVMGLTFSDTIRLGAQKNYLKLFAAPRGEATDGPVAFMHRPTGMVNPDAPLGHHIGQDVGHITSSVIGASLRLGDTTLEASTYYGREPEPTRTDVPLGKPDSYSARVIQQLSPAVYAMASAAYVHAPEKEEADAGGPRFLTRYSASLYYMTAIGSGWTFYNTLIYGAIHNYDETSLLTSYGEEWLLRGHGPNLWGRLEHLQRTSAELNIATTTDAHRGVWLTAATLGYTHTLAHVDGLEFGLGGAVTKDFLPAEFYAAYADRRSNDLSRAGLGSPWTGKVFIQLSGTHMSGM